MYYSLLTYIIFSGIAAMYYSYKILPQNEHLKSITKLIAYSLFAPIAIAFIILSLIPHLVGVNFVVTAYMTIPSDVESE